MQLTRRFSVCFENGKKVSIAEYRKIVIDGATQQGTVQPEVAKPCFFGSDGATVKFGNGGYRFADGRVAHESTHR